MQNVLCLNMLCVLYYVKLFIHNVCARYITRKGNISENDKRPSGLAGKTSAFDKGLKPRTFARR